MAVLPPKMTKVVVVDIKFSRWVLIVYINVSILYEDLSSMSANFLLHYTIVITDHLWQIKLLLLLIIIIIVVFDLYRYYYIIIIFLNTNENILLLKLIISIRISIENPSLYSHKYKETSQ